MIAPHSSEIRRWKRMVENGRMKVFECSQETTGHHRKCTSTKDMLTTTSSNTSLSANTGSEMLPLLHPWNLDSSNLYSSSADPSFQRFTPPNSGSHASSFSCFFSVASADIGWKAHRKEWIILMLGSDESTWIRAQPLQEREWVTGLISYRHNVKIFFRYIFLL